MNTNPSQPKLPRKRPKTQGEMRVDVPELHVEVLQLELKIQLLEKRLQKDKNVVDRFECPISPIHFKF